MRALTVATWPVDQRSVTFSEESVRRAGLISILNQYSVAPLVARAAEDLRASVVLPELDRRNASIRDAQSSTIASILDALDQRSRTLKRAADDVLAMDPPLETAYNPNSAADAVIKYAKHFVPSWARAIAIDLLPAVLVFVLAITQAAIRSDRDGTSVEDSLTPADLKAAMNAMGDVESSIGAADAEIRRRSAGPSPKPKVAGPAGRGRVEFRGTVA